MALTEFDVQPMLHGDGRDIKNKLETLAYLKAMENFKSDTSTSLSELEKELAAQFIAGRNGKVFATKIYNYSYNTSSKGEKMLDSVDLVCNPSTDTEVGHDDFAEASQIFTWMHCNYTRDADGTARPTALEGTPAFKNSGSVDVGTLAPTFYWKREEHGTYKVFYMSDSPNAPLGLVPFKDAVKADGTVLPFYVISSYYSATASDGLLRSQPESFPAYNNSYNNMITAYAKKGTGYQGGGISCNLHAMLFLIIKYATKNSQQIFAGCTDFNSQVKAAVAETDVKRVLVANASPWYVGCCLSISKAGLFAAPDRESADCHTTANRVKVKSIESVTVSGTAYTALNLDIDTAITVDTTMYVTTMPCFNGETDAVIGHYDGSYLSNKDAHHTFRIHGVEYMNGQAFIPSDCVLDKQGEYWCLFVAPKGVKHVANSHANYILAGKVPYNAGKDMYIGDIDVDPVTGALFPSTKGSGDSVGTGDYIWEGGDNLADGILREFYSLGHLGRGSADGLAYLDCRADLSWASWYYGSRD